MSRKPAPAPRKATKGPTKRVGQPKVNCPKNKAAPKKKPPCDFDRFTLKCRHNPAEDDDGYSQRKKGVKIWRHKTWYRHDAAPLQGGANSPPLVFELIATKQQKGYYDLIRIVIGGGPGYHCAHRHPHVLITNTNRGKVNPYKGTTRVLAQGWRAGVPASRARWPWTIISESLRPKINEYKIHIFACGVRPSGYPVRALYATVRVYPAERYKITISVPAAKKDSKATGGGSQINKAGDWRTKGVLGDRYRARSHETSSPRRGGSMKRESLETRSRDDQRKMATYTRTRVDASGRQRAASSSHSVDLGRPQGQEYARARARARSRVPRADTAGSWINFSVNDDKVDLGSALGRFLQDIALYKEQYDAMKQFIKDFQPQIGWKFTWDVEFFAGELSAEWGWKEDIDNEVYLWWKISGELTVVSAVAEISFGIEIWKVGIKVFGSLAGALKYDRTIEGLGKRDRGDEPGDGVSATFTGKVGVRAVVGADWLKAEASIVISLTQRFQVKFWRKFQVIMRTSWSGINAEIELSSKAFGYKRKQSYEIVEGDPNLAKFLWPAA